MESPRLIKSHLSYDMLPSEIESKEAKVFTKKLLFFSKLRYIFFSDNLRHQKSEGCLHLVLLFHRNLWRLSRYLGRVHGMFFERHDGILFALFLTRFILLESTAFIQCMLHYVWRNEGWFSVSGSKSCALFGKAIAEFTRGFWSISRSFVIQQNEEERGCQQSWFFGSK